MSDVEFETDNQFNITSPTIGIVRAENKMAEWLMRKRIAKNESQAQMMMLGTAAGALLIAAAWWFLVFPSDKSGQDVKGTIDELYRPATQRSL